MVDDREQILDALSAATAALLDEGKSIGAIAQAQAAMAATGLCHASGPEAAAKYLRDLAAMVEARGHRYAATMAGEIH